MAGSSGAMLSEMEELNEILLTFKVYQREEM
jgi:hypothetical protein